MKNHISRQKLALQRQKEIKKMQKKRRKPRPPAKLGKS
jgi:hypothetical protein